MFFRRRSAQAEYFDLPDRPEAETIAAFRDLDRLNRVFHFERPFEDALPEWLGPRRCAHLEILDLGAGTGLLGKILSEWAQARGWNWSFMCLDSSPLALKVGNPPRQKVGSVLALPFADASFDLVIASQMTHHLADGEIVRHWREAWRVTRDAVLISDLHRNAGLYALLWAATGLMRVCRRVREDSLVSVKRGFRLDEWRRLAQQAGLRNPRVWLYYGTRIMLQARKGEPTG
jgi:SAM-dependent methyltransferase